MKRCATCLLVPLGLAACDATYRDHESTDEDAPLEINIRGSSDDPYIARSPVHGTLSRAGRGKLRYQPSANFHGQDSFVYETDNGGPATDRTIVTIEVRPDDPPHEETRLALPLWAGAVAPADMDGDGRLDLVAADLVGALALLRNISESDGPLAFEVSHAPAQSTAPVGANPSLAVADWNRDGIDDVIVVSGTRTPVVWLGGAQRAEALTQVAVLGDLTERVDGAATGDFDGDTEPDLALVDSSAIRVLFGVVLDRDRLSDRGQVRRDTPFVRRLQAIDLDGDGFDDLFVAAREPRIAYGSENRLGPWLSPQLDFDIDLLLSLHEPSLGALAMGDEQWQPIDPETGQARPQSVRPRFAFDLAHHAAVARWRGEELLFISSPRVLALQRFVGTPEPSLVPRGDIEVEPGVTLGGVGAADLDGDGQDELWVGRFPSGDPTRSELGVLRGR